MDRDSYLPSPLADVGGGADGEGWTVVFVRHLRHPPDRVWVALTDPEELVEWAPFTANRHLSTTGDAVLTHIDGDVTTDTDVSVVVAEQPVILEYTWGTDRLRWKLEPTDEGTQLTLRHTLADRGDAPKVSAGWHIYLDVAASLLDGQPIGPIRGSESMQFGWTELRDAYAERLDGDGRG